MRDGENWRIKDDVKRMVVPVFAHRVVLGARVGVGRQAAGAAENILEEILTSVEVPL